MPAEVFLNVAESTLAVATTNVATTLSLVSGAPFNTVGQFRLRLDDSLQQPNGIATRYEICRATFSSGTVLNAYRTGVDLEGTTAQAWPIGTKVVSIVTAAGLANIGNGKITGRRHAVASTSIGPTLGVIQLDTSDFDPYAMGNTNGFTVANTGYWHVSCGCASVSASAGGQENLAVGINSAVAYTLVGVVNLPANSGLAGSTDIYVTSGQTINVMANSLAGAIAFTGFLSVHFLG